MIGRRVAALYRRVKSPIAVKAGVDRWAVKTGADPEAASVALSPVPATVQSLSALTPPHDPTARVAPTETTVYAVPCRIVMWKLEADGDHHLGVKDDQGNTMVCEIPDPQFVAATSPWLPQITAAHAAFDAHPLINIPVTIVGVGFFDRIHGQTDVAPNGVELHPVLSITPAP